MYIARTISFLATKRLPQLGQLDKKEKYSVILVLFQLCEQERHFISNARLPIDGNGNYHMTLLGGAWQTLHRISGYIVEMEGADTMAVFGSYVGWSSSHYWILGDTLGYIVNRGLTDDLIYVSYDTTYITGFDGMEVPTVKCKPSGREIFLKDENEQKFYLRTGPSTIELTGHEMQQFISQRFRNN